MQKYDVVIVGAGLAGLTCGLTLAKEGKKVKIIEQLPSPGGYCGTYYRKGFAFDWGVTLMFGTGEGGVVGSILDKLNLRSEIQLIDMEDMFKRGPLTIFLVDESITVPSLDINELVGAFGDKFSFEGLFEVMAIATTVYEEYQSTFMLSKELTSTLMEYKDRTFEEVLNEHIKDERLKSIISLPLLVLLGLPPSKLSAVLGLAGLSLVTRGISIPKGGARAMIEAFCKKLASFGGELELDTMVDKILVENGKAIGVRTSKGEEIRADYIVSNADAKETFFDLIGEEKVESKFASSLKESGVCLSSVALHLGVDIDSQVLESIPLAMIVSDGENIEKQYEAILEGRFPALVGGILSVIDPSLAPQGKHNMYLFTPAPYRLDWRREKNRVMEDLIKLAERAIPNLSKYIVLKSCSTPLDFEKYTLNTNGSFLGWVTTPAGIFNRPRPETPIENLYLTGHWTVPGGGTPQVIPSGYLVAQMILEKV